MRKGVAGHKKSLSSFLLLRGTMLYPWVLGA